MTEKKNEDLSVLFPGKEVSGIKVTPISLENLPKVIDAFGKVVQMADAGVGPSEIALHGLRELLLILPYCIDRPASEIPASIVPEIIDVVVEQNMSEAVLGKWTDLLKKVGRFRIGAEEVVEPTQSKASES